MKSRIQLILGIILSSLSICTFITTTVVLYYFNNVLSWRSAFVYYLMACLFWGLSVFFLWNAQNKAPLKIKKLYYNIFIGCTIGGILGAANGLLLAAVNRLLLIAFNRLLLGAVDDKTNVSELKESSLGADDKTNVDEVVVN